MSVISSSMAGGGKSSSSSSKEEGELSPTSPHEAQKNVLAPDEDASSEVKGLQAEEGDDIEDGIDHNAVEEGDHDRRELADKKKKLPEEEEESEGEEDELEGEKEAAVSEEEEESDGENEKEKEAAVVSEEEEEESDDEEEKGAVVSEEEEEELDVEEEKGAVVSEEEEDDEKEEEIEGEEKEAVVSQGDELLQPFNNDGDEEDTAVAAPASASASSKKKKKNKKDKKKKRKRPHTADAALEHEEKRKRKRKEKENAAAAAALVHEEEEEESGRNKKGRLFQRLWSEEDHVLLLQVMADYRATTNLQPTLGKTSSYIDDCFSSNPHGLLHRFSKNQIFNKIRTCRRKYLNTLNNNKNSSFLTPNQKKVFDLLNNIWGEKKEEEEEEEEVEDKKKKKKKIILPSSSSSDMMNFAANGKAVVSLPGNDDLEQWYFEGLTNVESPEERQKLEKKWNKYKRQLAEARYNLLKLATHVARISYLAHQPPPGGGAAAAAGSGAGN